MIVILYTLYPADPDTGATVVYRAATAGYRSWPTDDPANAVWPPLVTKRGDLLVQAPAPGEGRRTQAAEGRLQLSNAFDRQRGARPLSALADLVTHGKRILVQAVDARAPYSTAVTIFDGVMGAVDVSRSELTVNFKDRSADYDAPLLTEVYGGGGGLDGGASLKGKTKERCFGAVAFFEPTYLGPGGDYQLYSVNGGHAIDEIEDFGDSGASRPRVSAGPSASQWMVDLTTGVIRAGGPPCVAPWCRVRGDKSGGVYRATVGAIASHWLIDLTGLRSSVAGVAGVDAAPRTAGRFFAAGAAPTVRAAMDELMGSIWGGVWYEGALGVATVGRLPLVGGAVKAAYRERVNCDPIMPDSYSQDAAAKRIEWRYARNYNPAASPSQAATSEQVLRAITEWLVEPHDNGAVAAAWGNAARTVTVDSLLYNSADAAAEAALAAADLAYPWRVWRAPVWGGAAGVDIGDEILVYSDQPGFENGGRLIVIGRSLSNRAGRAILIGITR